MSSGGKCGSVVCAVVLVTLWGWILIPPAAATITTTGDIVPPYGATDPWVLSSDLAIGQDADAAIWVTDGSQVVDSSPDHHTSVIAAGSDVTASATLSGTDSVWGMFVMVGGYGSGTMVAEDGALVDTGGVWVGDEAGSIGNVLLTGPGTIWQGRPESEISIDGGFADPNGGYQHYVHAHIGNHGTGSFTVSDGARVVADGASVYLGYFADGVGSLTVTGPNSVWEETGDIEIGHLGAGALLISDGGFVTSTGSASIGNWPSAASRGSATVTDPNSLWRINGGLYVGGAGAGELLISNGGRVESEYAHVSSSEADANAATVTGPGSLWQIERYLVVGHFERGWLRVEDGGRVTDANAWVGWKAGSNGMVQIAGADSTWDNSHELHVGVAGEATLSVEEGGRVTSRTAFLGTESTGVGVALVTGPDSVWEILQDPNTGLGGDLYAGYSGIGDLAIGSGGRVASVEGLVGHTATGDGEVVVSGAGSLWENQAAIQIGVAGTGHLWISGGGTVTTRDAIAGADSNSEGTITVEGGGSALEVEQDLVVGVYGNGNLAISGGGQVSAGSAYLASDAGSGASAIVTGEDSLLAVANNLDIGGSGDANMVIWNGAHVTAFEASMAVGEDSNTVVLVTGAGSTLDIETDLNVGRGGAAELEIAEGGRVVTGSYASIGYDGLAHVTVDGAGSRWDSEGSLTVGMGAEGDLTVSNGGLVAGEQVSIGLLEIGSVTVTDPNSRLEYTMLRVGRLRDGTLTISNGAQVIGHVCEIAELNTPTGTLIVTGPGSLFENSGSLSVGTAGKGTLLVSDGGRVENGGKAVIAGPIDVIWPAEAAGAFGILGEIVVVEPNLNSGPSVATVTGEGSAWINAGNLYVGGGADGQYAPGRLRILDGGLVEANDVYVWNTGLLQGDSVLRAGSVLVQGTIRPGNSIGILTIDGDVVFDPCSVLEVELDNAAADKLAVTGDVEIAGGAVRAIATETIVGSHQYVIVEANNVSGQFDALDTALLDSFVYLETAALGYGADAVLLTVTSTPFDDPNIVRTGNQSSLGSALQQVAQAGGNDVTTALQHLQTGDMVRAAYDQLSGQTTPSLAPVSVAGTTRHVGAITGRLRNPANVSSGDALGESSMGLTAGDTVSLDAGRYLFAVGNGSPVLGDRPWGVWGRGYGLYGDREAESGAPGYAYTVYGAAFGLDYRFTDRLLLGVTGGYSEGDVDYAGSRDNSDVAATHGGLYGSFESSRWHLDSILTYTDLKYETHRYVEVLDERLEGDPSGNMLTGCVEAGLNWHHGERTLIRPLAALQVSTLKIDGFAETGGDGALTFDDQRYDSCKGSLGARIAREFLVHDDGRKMELELRGRWVHEFGDAKASVDASFAGNPGATFRVSDEDVARDSAVLGAGLDTWFTGRTRLFVDYGTELNADNTIHVVTAGLEHRW